MSIRSRLPTIFVRLLLVLFGGGTGLALALGLLYAKHLVQERPRKMMETDHAELRAKLDGNPNAIYMFDEQVSYRLKPNFVGLRPGTSALDHRTNSRGLLGTHEIAAESDTVKLVFLGDSVTFGDGVEFDDAFVTLMQIAAGDSCQLFNAGVQGWSTHQELRFFDKYLSEVDWSAVVLVVCFNDLVRFEWIYDSETGFRMSEEMNAVGGLKEANQSLEGLRLAALRSGFAADVKTAPLAAQNNTTLWAWDAEKWRAYLDDELRPCLARDLGRRLIVVMAPTRAQIEATLLGANRDLVLFPQRTLARFCAQAGIACIDVFEAMVAAGAAHDLFRDNLHFSAAGHTVVARHLWPRVRAQLLTRPAPVAQKAVQSPTRR